MGFGECEERQLGRKTEQTRWGSAQFTLRSHCGERPVVPLCVSSPCLGAVGSSYAVSSVSVCQLLPADDEGRQYRRHLRHPEAVRHRVEERRRHRRCHPLHPRHGQLHCWGEDSGALSVGADVVVELADA